MKKRNYFHVLLLLLSVFILSFPVFSSEVQITEIDIPVVSQPPRIDSDLNDQVWQKALTLTGFYQYPEYNKADVQTTVWLSRDNSWLYIAVRCHDPKSQGESFRQLSKVRDEAVHSTDDAIEVFIDAGTGGEKCAHLFVSVGNVQADQLRIKNRRDRAWNLPFISSAKADPHVDTSKGWSAELAIPLALLPSGKGQWKINIGRTRRIVTPVEFTCLAKLPVKSSFYNPQHFVTIKGMTNFKADDAFAPMFGAVEAKTFTLKDGKRGYPVALEVENLSGRAGKVEVVFQDLPPRGQGRQITQIVKLLAYQKKPVSFLVPVDAPGNRAAWAGIRKPGSEGWLQKMTVGGMDSLLPMSGYLNRNYYTAEKQAVAHVELEFPAEEIKRDGLTLAGVLLDDSGRQLESVQVACQGRDNTVSLTLTKLPAGEYPVTLTLKNRQQVELGQLALTLVKRVPSPEGVNEIKIDRHNRSLLVNGKPFFPLGVFGVGYWGTYTGWQKKMFNTQLDYFKQAGFNSYIDWQGYGKGRGTIQEAFSRMDAVAERGFKTFVLPYGFLPELTYSNPKFPQTAAGVIRKMPGIINQVKTHPSVIGYYHLDEPPANLALKGKKSIDNILEEFTDKIRETDPYHPVWMSLTREIVNPAWFETVADLLGSHNYYYVSAPETLNWIPQWCEMINRHAKRANGPTMLAVNLEYYYGDGVYWRPSEQRAASYFALVHGAKSLFYFAGPFTHKTTLQTQRELSREILEISPTLLSRTPRQAVTFTPQDAHIKGWTPDLNFPVVQALLKNNPDGGQLLLAINASRHPVSCKFNISSLTNHARVQRLFGDRKKFRVSGQEFSDQLEGLGTRVYKLEHTAENEEDINIHLAFSGPGATKANRSTAWGAPRKKESEKFGPNLLTNSGFETEGGWREEYMGSKKWGEMSIAKTMPWSGTSCLEFIKTDADSMCSVVSTPVILQPGKKYIFGGGVRFELQSGRQNPQFIIYSTRVKSGKRQVNSTAYGKTKDSAKWHKIEKVVTVPADEAEEVRLWCRVPKTATGKAWFDDCFIKEVLPDEKISKNLAPNSSFELASLPGQPDKWMGPAWDYLRPDPRASGLDTNNPYDGKYCFRLPVPEERFNHFEVHLSHAWFSLIADTEYTFSIYMRSELPDQPVEISLTSGTPKRTVKVGTTWKRYVVTFNSRTSDRCKPFMRFRGRGTVYFDAVQLEKGATATPYERDDYEINTLRK
ncbi:MAG: hypothetical protein ACYTFY_11065 [Planctomycetota bacterium]|jgi:hypothetical protein